jgi:Na+-translocating ferredoxin:NAD+ oxidoreductase subunit C
MKRRIKSSEGRAPAPLADLRIRPQRLMVSLRREINRTEVKPCVVPGESVRAGDAVARGPALTLHSALDGRVETVEDAAIRIAVSDRQEPVPVSPAGIPDPDQLSAFASAMGLSGMGGSMFPSSIKLAASREAHTLIINAVECEPGIEIDEALLLEQPDLVTAGVRALHAALGFESTVLAVKPSSVQRLSKLAESVGWDICAMSEYYPGGAEKLIVRRLAGRMPPTGTLPFHWGYLVLSSASLWSLARSVSEGRPCIDRPLTVVAAGREPVNLIAPIGCPIGDVLDACGVEPTGDDRLIVAGGLMMGRRVSRDDPVLKGTNALFSLPIARRLTEPEKPCTLCGSCFDACPLKLHPIGMAERILRGERSRALEAHLEECFLCGACSAVCPSDIPLVQTFQQGKQWRRE